jgi:hypothetical protein
MRRGKKTVARTDSVGCNQRKGRRADKDWREQLGICAASALGWEVYSVHISVTQISMGWNLTLTITLINVRHPKQNRHPFKKKYMQSQIHTQ